MLAVKRSRSATRMLQVFEAIAAKQPIGVSALSRSLNADKSAVQRDLMTLADAGWIRPLSAGLWELTPRILTLAHTPHSSNELRQRARPTLETLRQNTGETAYLAVLHEDHFVVIDALESPQVLRMVPPIGLVIPIHGSATARAILPYLNLADQTRLLGAEPNSATLKQFADTITRGFAVNDGDIVSEAIAIASAILDGDGQPLGALVLTGPSERIDTVRRMDLGTTLVAAARSLY